MDFYDNAAFAVFVLDQIAGGVFVCPHFDAVAECFHPVMVPFVELKSRAQSVIYMVWLQKVIDFTGIDFGP